MERIVRTLRVDGHEVAVIEMMDEDEVLFVISVDDVVINADGPLPRAPNDRELCEAVRRWSEGR